MQDPDGLYAALGLDTSATAEEIKAAYRAAAKRAHPDAGGDTEAFHSVNRAVSVLLDPEKRKRYDETGHADTGPKNEEGKAREDVAYHMLTFLLDEETDNLDHHVIDALVNLYQDREQSFIKSQIATMRRMARIERALKPLAFAGAGPDFVRKAIEDRLRDLKKEDERLKEQRAHNDRCIDLVRQYQWKEETPGDLWGQMGVTFNRPPQNQRPRSSGGMW